MKVIVDNKFNLTVNVKYTFHRLENIVEKGEKSAFSFTMFSKGLFLSITENMDCVVKK